MKTRFPSLVLAGMSALAGGAVAGDGPAHHAQGNDALCSQAFFRSEAARSCALNSATMEALSYCSIKAGCNRDNGSVQDASWYGHGTRVQHLCNRDGTLVDRCPVP